ncbi:MAG: hypothetical protein OCD01_05020 [Fibrobacterales bacterium]
MKQKGIVALILILVVLSGCTRTRVFPRVGHGIEGESEMQSGKTLLLINGNVLLTEFQKTYNDKFKSDYEFHDHLKMLVERHLKSKYSIEGFNSSFYSEFQKSHQYINDYLKERKDQITSEGYTNILLIDKLIVGNEVTSSTHSNGMGMTSTSSSESALITARFQVIPMNDIKPVADFTVMGTSSVSFFMFETALLGACDNLIKRTRDYLAKNKVKF